MNHGAKEWNVFLCLSRDEVRGEAEGEAYEIECALGELVVSAVLRLYQCH